jgi:hypothetical protein
MTNNTDKKFNDIIEGAKKNGLAKEEKREIKSHLVYFMKKNPEIARGYYSPVKASWQSENWLYLYFGKIVKSISVNQAALYAALAIVVLLIGGAGISVAAQNALPGDPLYPIKTGINEKVSALTLFSNQAKAEYNINLAQLRLEEAEIIAAQNRLNAESSHEVINLLSDHLADIKNRIVNLKNKEGARVAAELNSKLETVLKNHEQIINKLSETK